MSSIFDIPARGQSVEVQPGVGGVDPWEDAVNFTLKHEGGLNPRDTNGTPSNFGMNQAANPDINVLDLTPETAKARYRTKYWDAISGDELAKVNPQLAKIAFDTSVLAGTGKAKELLAQSGNDPQKFMDLRESFLQGLLQKDPAKYGPYEKAWATRNANLRGGNFSGSVQGQSSLPQNIDLSSLMDQYGADPNPIQQSTLPNILPIVPDVTDAAQGIEQSALGRGIKQALSTPQPQMGKLPFGIENKGSRFEQAVKDVAYGVPEGIGTLVAGIPGFIGGQAIGAAELSKPRTMTENLAGAFDVAERVAHASMGTPQTATAQLLMKPIEVTFGTMLNTIGEVVKDLNPEATSQELETKTKAAQYVANTLLLGLPLAAKKFNSAVKITPEKVVEVASPEAIVAAKESVKADPNVAPEVKAQVDAIDINPIDAINQKIATAQAKARVEKSGGMAAKVPENQSIVDGLLMEVELREGRAKVTMRKAAKIVAEHDGDIALADLNNIKGINVKGSTGKTIARLVAERDALKKSEEKIAQGTGDDVPLTSSNMPSQRLPKLVTGIDIFKVEPIGEREVTGLNGRISYTTTYKGYDKSGNVYYKTKENGVDITEWEPGAVDAPTGQVKSFEEVPLKIDEALPEVPLSEPALTVDPIHSMVQSVDPALKYDGVMKGIPEARIPDMHNLTLTLEDGRQPSFSIAGEITPEKVAEEVGKVRERFKVDEEVKVEPLVKETKDGKVQREAEEIIIPEFDDVTLASEEGYSFPQKKRYSKLEDAQAKAAELGESHEVVKIGEKYRVAKFNEMPEVKEFASEIELNNAGWELMSEIPKDKVAFESPSEGFGLAKVGDKYYRISTKVEMPRRGTIAPVEVPDMVGDGVSLSDYQALLKFTDEATIMELDAQSKLKELVATFPDDKISASPESNAALAKAFLEWRDSYVTKSYTATSKASKKPTKESLAPLDDALKSFESEQAATEWMMATDTFGKLVQDPETGRWSIVNAEKFKKLDELDMWDEGVEQLTSRRGGIEEDYGTSPDFELSDTGKMDLWSILNNERGSVDVTGLRSAVNKIESIVKIAEKLGKTIDDYLASIGADEAAIAAFNAALAQVPQMKQQIREQDPVTSAILMPEGKIVAQRVNKNKAGQIKSVGPPITESLATKVMNAPRDLQWGTDIIRKDPETGRIRAEHTSNAFERAMQATEVKINSFRAAGIPELYHQWREAKKMAQDEKVQVNEWLDSLEKQINPERREAFAIAAYADMKSVKEAFAAMGITKIPELTPKESMVLEQLLDYTRKFRDRSNYVRTHTGQKAIPQLKDMKGRENYLPLMRDLNVLRDLGVTEGMVISDSTKLGELSKNFNGMFNPHSKKRNVSDIPIELDPFKALRRHAEYGLDEIHISPVAALAKDLANQKLPRVDQAKGKISLSDWNPYLSRMLSRWSDQIVGKDVVGTAIANANPFFSWAKDRLAKNLVVATIGGSLRTVLVQPTSYMIGIPTMLDMRSAGYGIWKLMSERPFGKSNAKQNSSILAIREADYAFSELAEYIKQGKISGTKAYLAEKSLAPMKWVDSLMAEAGWNAARYYGEKRLGLQGKELYRFADDVVERTQGLGIKGAVSDIQSSAATKWLTLLQTFAIADFNLIARDVLGIKNPEMNQTQTIKRVAKYVGVTILAGQMYKMIGMDNVVPDPIGAYLEAKEEGRGDLKAVGTAAGELLEKVPIIGGSAKFGSSLFGIAGEWADIVPEAGEKFSASLDWSKLTPKQKSYNIRLIARAVGLTAGIPMTNQILKSINSAYKGGNPWQVILGVYDKEKQRKGGLRPQGLRPSLPKPGL